MHTLLLPLHPVPCWPDRFGKKCQLDYDMFQHCRLNINDGDDDNIITRTNNNNLKKKVYIYGNMTKSIYTTDDM